MHAALDLRLKELGHRSILVQPPDGFREQGRAVEHHQFVPQLARADPERRDRVGDDHYVQHGIGEDIPGLRGKHALGCCGDDSRRAVAAMLRRERRARRPSPHARQMLPETLRPLDAPGVRRHDDDLVAACHACHVRRELGGCLEVLGATTKGILVGIQVAHVHRHHCIATDSLEERGDIPCAHRIARLCLVILARICQVRDDGGDPGGCGILQGPDKRTTAGTACR